jgi:F0F1-type ATP synthase membrane subunit c/vacuolar-type H+-ATPase subunit K
MDNKRQSMIHLALIGMLGVYGLVAFLVLAKSARPTHMPTLFAYALSAVAAFEIIVVIPFLRRMFYPPTRPPTSLDDRAPTCDAVSGALARLSSAQIVVWAMCESIAIYGVVLVSLSHDTRYYLGFGLASLVNLLWYRPSDELALGVARAAAHAAEG